MAKEFQSLVPKVYTGFRQNQLTKQLLKDVKLIGQLDRKFILGLTEGDSFLLIFDQHAVHERIRLEELLEGVSLSGKFNIYDDSFFLEYTEVTPGGHVQLKSTTRCKRPITIKLEQSQLQILENFKDAFEKLGLKFQCFPDHLKILCLPSCLNKKVSVCENKIISLTTTLILDYPRSGQVADFFDKRSD